MGYSERELGLRTLICMSALTSLVLWMLYGIALSLSHLFNPPPYPADPTPFDGIAAGLIIGVLAALVNGFIVALFAVAYGLIKNKKGFAVPRRNTLYYAAIVGLNILLLLSLYAKLPGMEYVLNLWTAIFGRALDLFI